jgi:pheromone shutdown protein TraB
LESVQDDVSSVKGFYKNRLLRVLLVFILSSLGSSIGTFVAGSSLVVGLTQSISAMLN